MNWDVLFTLCPLADGRARQLNFSYEQPLRELVHSRRMDVTQLIVFSVINAQGFTYTGTPYAGTSDDWVRNPSNGDCSTLSSACQYLLEQVGITSELRHARSALVVMPQIVVGATTSSNIGQDGFWYLDKHYWVAVDGVEYDLLFGGGCPDLRNRTKVTEEPVEGAPQIIRNGVQKSRYTEMIHQFGDYQLYEIGPGNLTLDPLSAPTVFDWVTEDSIFRHQIDWNAGSGTGNSPNSPEIRSQAAPVEERDSLLSASLRNAIKWSNKRQLKALRVGNFVDFRVFYHPAQGYILKLGNEIYADFEPYREICSGDVYMVSKGSGYSPLKMASRLLQSASISGDIRVEIQRGEGVSIVKNLFRTITDKNVSIRS